MLRLTFRITSFVYANIYTNGSLILLCIPIFLNYAFIIYLLERKRKIRCLEHLEVNPINLSAST